MLAQQFPCCVQDLGVVGIKEKPKESPCPSVPEVDLEPGSRRRNAVAFAVRPAVRQPNPFGTSPLFEHRLAHNEACFKRSPRLMRKNRSPRESRLSCSFRLASREFLVVWKSPTRNIMVVNEY